MSHRICKFVTTYMSQTSKPLNTYQRY